MLDIVVMLFHILRAYLPSEIKWSFLGNYFDMFGWTCCMGTVLYCVFWTVRCGTEGGERDTGRAGCWPAFPSSMGRGGSWLQVCVLPLLRWAPALHQPAAPVRPSASLVGFERT